MGSSREHVENGQRRLEDCKERFRRQRDVVGALHPENENRAKEIFLPETFEKPLLLMESHQQVLIKRFRRTQF